MESGRVACDPACMTSVIPNETLYPELGRLPAQNHTLNYTEMCCNCFTNLLLRHSQQQSG